MKYDERTCKFNMDTGCVELLLRDGRMISIDCTGVEDGLDVTMAQRTELDYLIFNKCFQIVKTQKISSGALLVYVDHRLLRTKFLPLFVQRR